MSETYYTVLELTPAADAASIERAYQRLSTTYDPAAFSAAAPEIKALAATKYAALATAYATLCDPATRTAYDASLQASEVAEQPASARLDYRPLPPRRESDAVRPIGERSRSLRLSGWTMLLITFWLTAGTTGALVWLGTRPPAPQATSQMPLFATLILAEIPDPQVRDQLLSLDATAAQGRTVVRENRFDPQAWIFLGNAHFDFIQTIYEHAPGGEAYTQNLNRWLDASAAYSEALKLDPLQPVVRTDYALALIRYGQGLGNPSYVQQGVAEAERALRDDDQTPQVLLNVGRAFAITQPPRTIEAQRVWQRLIALAPESPQAAQAQRLLEGANP